MMCTFFEQVYHAEKLIKRQESVVPVTGSKSIFYV